MMSARKQRVPWVPQHPGTATWQPRKVAVGPLVCHTEEATQLEGRWAQVQLDAAWIEGASQSWRQQDSCQDPR
jgi:hypothetical protein